MRSPSGAYLEKMELMLDAYSTYIQTCSTYIHAHIHIYIHTCIHTYSTYIQYIHTCMHTCIQYIHTYIQYIHAYKHIYIHKYMHTCMHTSIHTYIAVTRTKLTSVPNIRKLSANCLGHRKVDVCRNTKIFPHSNFPLEGNPTTSALSPAVCMYVCMYVCIRVYVCM